MPPLLARFLLIDAIVILGLASKPARYHPVFFFLALSIFISTLITPYLDVSMDIKFMMTFMAAIIGSAFDLLVISNPQDSDWRNGDKKPASQRPFLQRIKWAAIYLCNPRRTNWNCAIPGLLRYPTPSSRLHFIVSRLRQAVFYFVLRDALSFVLRRNPALRYPPTESMAAHGFVWQAINVLSFWVRLQSSIALNHAIASAATVAIRVWDPEDWPEIFGPWSETTSLRTFWGKTWHQICRSAIQPQSKYFTLRILRLRPGSLLSRYTQLLMCFFLSGVNHAACDWTVQRNLESVFNVVKFYVLQAVIIMFEDFITLIGNTMGVKRVPRVVSYVWVVALMGLSGPVWMETMVKAGLFDKVVLSKRTSVIEKISGYIYK